MLIDSFSSSKLHISCVVLHIRWNVRLSRCSPVWRHAGWYALFIIHVSCCCVFILGLFFQHTGKCSQPRCYSENPSNPRWTRQKKKTGISLHVPTYANIYIRIYRSIFTLSLVWTQLDNAVEKSGKLVLTNWSEQIKVRKYL